MLAARAKPPFGKLRAGHPLVNGLGWALAFNEIGGGTVYDAGPKQANFTVVGTTISSNLFGAARQFNGSSDYIWVTNALSQGILTPGGLSIGVVWTPLLTGSASNQDFVRQDTPTTLRHLFRLQATTNIIAFLVNASSSASVNGSAVVAGTTYVHIGSYDGANLRLYKDGVLDAGPTVLTGNVVTSTQYGIIGAAANDINTTPVAITGYANVKIALVVFWNRGLSADEAQLFTEDPFGMFRRPIRNPALQSIISISYQRSQQILMTGP